MVAGLKRRGSGLLLACVYWCGMVYAGHFEAIPTVDFGDRVAGEAHTKWTELTNITSRPLAVVLSFREPNPGLSLPGGMSFVIPPRERHSFKVDWHPVETGSMSAVIDVTSTEQGVVPPDVEQNEIAVSGQAVTNHFSAIPSVTYGEVLAGQTHNRWIQLVNQSGYDLEVALALPNPNPSLSLPGGTGFTLAPGGSKSFKVKWQPVETGPIDVFIQLTGTAMLPGGDVVEHHVIRVTGQVVTYHFGTMPSVDYGPRAMGVTHSIWKQLVNQTEYDLDVVLSLSNPNPGLSLPGGTTFTIPVGGKKSIKINWLPAEVGILDSYIHVQSTIDVGPHLETELNVIPVTGEALAQHFASIPSVDFGDQVVGSLNEVWIQLTNVRGLDLDVALQLPPAYPELSIPGGTSFVIEAGDSRAFKVQWEPTSPGPLATEIQVVSDPAGLGGGGGEVEHNAIPVQGNALLGPVLEVWIDGSLYQDGDTYDFGDYVNVQGQPIQNDDDVVVTLKNVGDTELGPASASGLIGGVATLWIGHPNGYCTAGNGTWCMADYTDYVIPPGGSIDMFVGFESGNLGIRTMPVTFAGDREGDQVIAFRRNIRFPPKPVIYEGTARAPGDPGQSGFLGGIDTGARGTNSNQAFQASGDDSINLLNGNLMRVIPIGPSYTLGPRFSYSLNLVYNSNAWDTALDENNGWPYTVPNQQSNAGLGWHVMLGQLYESRAGLNRSEETWPNQSENPDLWLYVAQDGQQIYLDKFTDGHFYSKGREKIRLRFPSANTAKVDFPNGVTHTFNRAGSDCSISGECWRIGKMEDLHGNNLVIAYDDTAHTWTLTDSESRTHVLYFSTADAPGGPPVGGEFGDLKQIVDTIELEGADNQTMTFDFIYRDVNLNRACPVDDRFTSHVKTMSVPLLEFLELPEASAGAYEFRYNYDYEAGQGCDPYAGTLKEVVEPTGSSIAYEYSTDVFKTPLNCVDFHDGRPIPKETADLLGVTRKSWRDSDGDEVDWESYHFELLDRRMPFSNNQSDCNRYNTARTTIDRKSYSDRRMVRTYYHTVTPTPNNLPVDGTGSPLGLWRLVDRGLPVTKRYDEDQGNGNGTIYLSRDVIDCHNNHGWQQCASLQQGTANQRYYLRFAIRPNANPSPGVECATHWSDPDCHNDDVQTQIEMDNNKTGADRKWRTHTHNGYDYLGNFRSVRVTSNYPHSQWRPATFVRNYNATTASLSFPRSDLFNLPGGFSYPGTWLLGVFGYKETLDEAADTRHREDFYFDTSGFLQCRRKRTNHTGLSDTDLVSKFTKNGKGFVSTEDFYGGDKGGAGASGTCPTGARQYRLAHTYEYGRPATTWFRNAADQNVPPQVLDLSYDKMGNVLTARDHSTSPVLTTENDYDSMGRLLESETKSGAQSLTKSVTGYFLLANGARLTNHVSITATDPAEVVSQSELTYDEFRRLTVSRARTSAGAGWAKQENRYNGAGWLKKSTTVQDEHAFDDSLFFDYQAYDIYGKLTHLKDPENNLTRFYSNDGRWDVQHSSRIVDGVRVETVKRLDHTGRLWKTEIRQDGDETWQEKDEVIRDEDWVVVRRSDAEETITQSRGKLIDARGFVKMETNPETGTISYDYDALGNVVARHDALRSLSFTYDAAGRLRRIDESLGGPATQVMKEFFYDAQGKIFKAIRHNRLSSANSFGLSDFLGNPVDVTVEELYSFNGLGLPSDRNTQVRVGGNLYLEFDQGWQYDELGRLKGIEYPSETISGWEEPQRTVTLEYSLGELVTLKNNGVRLIRQDYHHNGLLKDVSFYAGDGITVMSRDSLTLPPSAMSRVHQITTKELGTPIWSTGAFQYDGSGNIVGIGDNTYQYDKFGRLTSASGDTDQQYGYDIFDNLLSITGSPAAPPFTVDADTNRIDTAISIPVLYDAVGNFIKWDDGASNNLNISYDVFNKPIAWSDHTDDANPTADFDYQAMYVYNAADQRLLVLDHYYDAAYPEQDFDTLLVTVRDLDGGVLREFREAETVRTTKDYIYSNGTLRAIASGGSMRHIHVDHLGSPRVVTNDGPFLQKDFTPYGSFIDSTDDLNELADFTGHERNRNLLDPDPDREGEGLTLWMKAREYLPIWGRFVSPDPARDGWNLYAYAGNNPITFSDPSGMEKKKKKQGNNPGTGSGNGASEESSNGNQDCDNDGCGPSPAQRRHQFNLINEFGGIGLDRDTYLELGFPQSYVDELFGPEENDGIQWRLGAAIATTSLFSKPPGMTLGGIGSAIRAGYNIGAIGSGLNYGVFSRLGGWFVWRQGFVGVGIAGRGLFGLPLKIFSGGKWTLFERGMFYAGRAGLVGATFGAAYYVGDRYLADKVPDSWNDKAADFINEFFYWRFDASRPIRWTHDPN